MELDEAKMALRVVLRSRRRAMDPGAVREAAEAMTRAVLARQELVGARTVALSAACWTSAGKSSMSKT